MDLLIKNVELPKVGEMLTLTIRPNGYTWASLRNWTEPDKVWVTEAAEVRDNKLSERTREHILYNMMIAGEV